ncbi:MAG: glycoside hydrolase family 2 TIM barrel-domain containing protein [Clostridia bacterium]|nr:glycoside hydrolase family 2 TIM barrel-domain containing protein [Clostridia bacterium]MDY4083383.1 glycoside hydrolase family 2 TIM barrel-domain containing protein [Eubacteriales bacterium]
MRKIININDNWQFIKQDGAVTSVPSDAQAVNLPHTWNATDGQDGGNDYYRGACSYFKTITKSDLPQADRYYIEVKGANSSATVYIDGKKVVSHDGGYSTFRADVTGFLQDTSLLQIVVDNSPSDTVYPQMADFTFYGGLYRDVNLIAVSSSHFDLDYYGGSGIAVTPEVQGDKATIDIHVYLTDYKPSQSIHYTIFDGQGNEVASTTSQEDSVRFMLDNPHLWQGRLDPYLYTATAKLVQDGKTLDEISTRFGIRSFRIDPEQGFFLNGKSYPLHGVSRHQDRLGVGNALTREHHIEDMDLICEVGANTIRLAHYQHDDFFYDLCDERGMVVWAEIPYISNHMPSGMPNTLSQMQELIVQNYNHPSIVVWGLSNEITMSGESQDMIDNHRALNELAHSLDPTRSTVVAVVSMCSIDSEYIKIPDAISYNHYFGWYGGDVDMNGPWFDKFHAKYPDIPIGCSEYGCEALNWHNSNPTQGDYSEEYQAYYHEELIKQLFSRPYIWATHVWNMFDFGADARAEGGENGQNHKGLVTFDRSYKKDSFYIYKAWLSDEKFVHICSKRYVDRVEDKTTIKVYSNMDEVQLFVNGMPVGSQKSEGHIFRFTIDNKGTSTIEAKAGDCRDTATIRKVDKFNDDYILKEKNAVLNWFDVEAPEGRFSLNDKFSDILSTFMGKLWAIGFGIKVKRKINLANKSKPSSQEGNPAFKMNGDMLKMVGGFTVLRLTGMMGMLNVSFSKEELLSLNRALNRIKKPKSTTKQ